MPNLSLLVTNLGSFLRVQHIDRHCAVLEISLRLLKRKKETIDGASWQLLKTRKVYFTKYFCYIFSVFKNLSLSSQGSQMVSFMFWRAFLGVSNSQFLIHFSSLLTALATLAVRIDLLSSHLET